MESAWSSEHVTSHNAAIEHPWIKVHKNVDKHHAAKLWQKLYHG